MTTSNALYRKIKNEHRMTPTNMYCTDGNRSFTDEKEISDLFSERFSRFSLNLVDNSPNEDYQNKHI